VCLGKTGDNFFFDNTDHASPNHPTPNRAQAADNRHQQDLHAGLETKYAVGVNEGRVAGKHTAGHAGESGRDSVGLELIEERIDAGIGGGVLILVDRHQA
jgi:hypothetical protein